MSAIPCPFHDQLQAYYDGQLPAVDRAAVEAHLLECSTCSETIADFRALSGLFAAAPRPRLSQIAVHRLQRRVDATMQRGVLRMARILAAAAACVVLGGSLRLMQARKAPEAAPPWVDVASASDADPSARDAGTPAARWYLADASQGSGWSAGLDNVP